MFGGRGFSIQEYGHSGLGRGRGSEQLHGGVPLGGVENIGAPRLGGGGHPDRAEVTESKTERDV